MLFSFQSHFKFLPGQDCTPRGNCLLLFCFVFRHSHPNCLALDGLVPYKIQLQSMLTQVLKGQPHSQQVWAWSSSSANQASRLQMLNQNEVTLPSWLMWSLFLTEKHGHWSPGTASWRPTVLCHFRGLCWLNSLQTQLSLINCFWFNNRDVFLKLQVIILTFSHPFGYSY